MSAAPANEPCNPLQTMDWLVAQFQDRARDDPSPNTETDAKQVKAARDAFVKLMDFVRSVSEGASVSGRWLDTNGDAIDGFHTEDDRPPEDEFPGAYWELYSGEENENYLAGLGEEAKHLVSKMEPKA